MFINTARCLFKGAGTPLRSFSTGTSLRAIKMEKVDTTERLKALRSLMSQHKVDLYSMLDQFIYAVMAD